MKQIELKNKIYYISTDGKVYNDKNEELELRIHRGRQYFHRYSVHRLVAKLYLSDFVEEYEIHHRDHDRLNNDVSNLVCLSKAEHYELHKDDIISSPEVPKRRKNKKTSRAYNKKYHSKRKKTT